MSRIYVNRIEALAAKRIERASQVAALPPQPARLDTNLWGQMRTPWMHARYVGMMSRVVGRNDPIKEALGESKTLQTWVTNNYPEYTLEELLVSPELPSEVALAIQEQVAYYDPSAPSAELMGLYEPAGYQLTSDANMYSGSTLGQGRTVFAGQPIAGPCILREVYAIFGAITWNSLGEYTATLSVDGYGTVLEARNGWEQNLTKDKGRSAKGLGIWVMSASVIPRIEISNRTGADMVVESVYNVGCTVEPLIRKM